MTEQELNYELESISHPVDLLSSQYDKSDIIVDLVDYDFYYDYMLREDNRNED